MPELAERVARVEEHIAHQNGTLDRIEDVQVRIEGKQDELAADINELGESLAWFKGAWTAVGAVFMIVVGSVLTVFGKKLGS